MQERCLARHICLEATLQPREGRKRLDYTRTRRILPIGAWTATGMGKISLYLSPELIFAIVCIMLMVIPTPILPAFGGKGVIKPPRFRRQEVELYLPEYLPTLVQYHLPRLC